MLGIAHRSTVDAWRGRGLPRRGLAGFWDFRQRTNSDLLYDVLGSAADGRLGSAAGADANDPDWFGKTLVFGGVGDYVNLDAAGPVYGSAWSVMVAVKALAQSGKVIYSEGNSESADPFLYLATGTTGTSKLKVVARESGAAVKLSVESTATIADNAWHLFCVTDDGGAYAIYVDGATPQTGSYTQASVTLDRATLGALGTTSYSAYLGGNLAAVLRWNRALSAADYRAARRYLKKRLGGNGVLLT